MVPRTRTTGIGLFLVLLAGPALGQTAGMLSFQGFIKDVNGDPVTGSVDLVFRIYDAEQGGNLVDMDGDGAVEDVIGEDAKEVLGVAAVGGLLSTKFGPVAPSSFDGTERWLEVLVDGEPLTRLEMVTAPATAEQVNVPGSGSSAIYVDAIGNVGIGTTEPTRALHVVKDGVAFVLTEGYDSSGGFIGQRGTGSPSAPQPTLANKPLCVFGGNGYGTSGFADAERSRGRMTILSAEDWTDTAQGTRIRFLTTQIGTTTPVNRMEIADNGNVGIGTLTPEGALHVHGPGAAIHVEGTGGDVAEVYLREGGDSGVRMVYSSTDNNLSFIPRVLGVDRPVALSIDRSTSNVGIGTTNPEFLLHVDGDAGKPGGGSWSTASDRRLKKNIRGLAESLGRLLQLRGVRFEYKSPETIHERAGEQIGMIAQEVEETFPDWVHTAADGYKRLTFHGFEALTVEALRELRSEKDAQIAELNARLDRMEALMGSLTHTPAGRAR